MSSEPLFDHLPIDLSGSMLSPEEIDDLLPQTGDMRQIQRVPFLSPDPQRGIGIKEVGNEEFWVPGHIPGRPLLPGVMMIEAAAQVSSILYQVYHGKRDFIGFTRCEECSFRGQVIPGDTLIVLALERRFQRRRFICQTQGYVKGELVFEALITGMTM